MPGAVLPCNPYFVSESVLTVRPPIEDGWAGPYPGFFDTHNYGVIGPDWIPGFTLSVPSVPEDVVKQVVNRAAKQSLSSVWDVAAFVGESKDTFRMLKSRLRDLFRIAKAVKAEVLRREALASANNGVRNLSKFAKQNTFDNVWLEFRYGWYPLVMDVKSAVESINASITKGDFQHGGTRRVIPFSDSKSWSSTPAWNRNDFFESISGSHTVSGFALSKVSIPTLARYGLNPVTTFWEVTKFSWLVDWFLDVGSWLAVNTAAFSGRNVVSSGYSIKTTYRRIVTASAVYGLGGSNTAGGISPGSRILDVRTYTRQPYEGGSWPGITTTISPVHLIDLTALASQLMKDLWRYK